MQFFRWKRLVLCSGIAALLFLSIVLVTTPANAGPNAAPPVQRLPTRPKPPATSKPDKPSQPSSPTATPVPAATETPTSTNTPVPTATTPPTSTPTPTSTFTPTPTPIAIVEGEAWQDLVLPLEGRIEIAFGQLVPDVQTLNRDDVQVQYTVDLPENLQIAPADSYIDLLSSHYPQEPDKPSTLEIEVNGRLLSAISLTPENAAEGQTRIELPARLLAAGANQIVVRLQSGAKCEDAGTLLNVDIAPSSLLSFGYELGSYPVNLARYPLPFAEKGLLRAPVTLVLPDQPTSDNLSAALTLAAGLGQASEGAVDLRTISAKAFDVQMHGNSHLILLGQPDTHALLNEIKPAPAVKGADIKAEQGFLELTISPWNEHRLLLIVSGADDQGILQASHVLNLKERFPPIRGSSATVASYSLPTSTPAVDLAQTMTLSSLGGQDETIYGAKPTELSYDFMLPPGWQLTGSPTFTLRFSHSNVLDPARSVIDVRLNGQPVGNIVLDDSNATEGEWLIPLRQRALQAGRNRLRIGIEMTLPGAGDADLCRLADDKQLWTVVSSESEVAVPYTVVDYRPNLGLWPYPYASRFGISQSMFVLPDQPDTALVNDLLLLGARLGAASDMDYLPAHIAYASEADRATWQTYHLVLLGRATQNALLGQLNQYLPRPFAVGQESGEKDSDVLAPVATGESSTSSSGQPTSAAFQLDPKRDTGVLQTVRSPWNQVKALLAVAGTTDKGVRLALQALLESSQNLEGNIAIIDLVSGDSNQISVYATDTRPADSTVDSGSPEGRPTRDVTPEPNTILLAQRWWK